MYKRKTLVLLTLTVFALTGGVGAVADDDDNDNDNDGRGRSHGHHKKNYKNPPATFKNEFALFDGSNPANQPDSGAICGAKLGKPYTYHLAVSNYGPDGFVRITYIDGDWVQFPIAAGAFLNLTQAGGSKGGADAVVRISNGDSAAQLSGVLSATGAKCGSCDADDEGGLGDEECDAFVPN